MKVSLEQTNTNEYIEGSIKLINNSSEMLQNIKFSFETIPLNLLECKVVRERGALCFSAPEADIELGNLYPEEIAYLYCKVNVMDLPKLSTLDYSKQIKISFSPENEILTTHLLSDLIATPSISAID